MLMAYCEREIVGFAQPMTNFPISSLNMAPNFLPDDFNPPALAYALDCDGGLYGIAWSRRHRVSSARHGGSRNEPWC